MRMTGGSGRKVSFVTALVALALCLMLLASASALAAVRPVNKSRTPAGSGKRNARGTTGHWYLPEGSTAWGFRTYVQVENAGSTDELCTVYFMKTNGAITGVDCLVNKASMLFINPEDYLGSCDFSTEVAYTPGASIAASRVMIAGTGSNSLIHSSIGSEVTSTNWYLPEGSTGGDFDTFVLVQNPNSNAVSVNLVMMTPEGSMVPIDPVVMPANSRHTFRLRDYLPGEWSISSWVSSADQVVAERAVYWGPGGTRIGGHESIGITDMSNSWFLAEGSTGGDFETWVLLMNSGSTPAAVQVDFYTDSGPQTGPSFTLDGFSRRTVRVNDYVSSWSVATEVNSSQPILAERAMYGNGRQWGHDSIGMVGTHTAIYLPFSECGSDSALPGYTWESWTLVQNTNAYPVDISIWYLTTSESSDNYYLTDRLPAYTRRSYNMADHVPSPNTTGVAVYCESGAGIMAENSTYCIDPYGLRIAGCDTIGGFAD